MPEKPYNIIVIGTPLQTETLTHSASTVVAYSNSWEFVPLSHDAECAMLAADQIRRERDEHMRSGWKLTQKARNGKRFPKWKVGG